MRRDGAPTRERWVMVELALMSVGMTLILVIFAFVLYSFQASVTSTENRLKDRRIGLIVRVKNTVHEALLFLVSMILCLFSLLDGHRHHLS
jgi:hypothetical protein